jgi:putative transposase
MRHPLVFLTVCTARRAQILANAHAHDILKNLWTGSCEYHGWWVGRYVLMPDHVHLFAMPDLNPKPLGKWVASWKSMSSHLLTAGRQVTAPVWQRDYFDRYVRTVESYGEKWDYVCNNPVRAGLVTLAANWPFQGVIHDLMP